MSAACVASLFPVVPSPQELLPNKESADLVTLDEAGRRFGQVTSALRHALVQVVATFLKRHLRRAASQVTLLRKDALVCHRLVSCFVWPTTMD